MREQVAGRETSRGIRVTMQGAYLTDEMLKPFRGRFSPGGVITSKSPRSYFIQTS
jgi:hypothetical protein